VFKFVFIGLLLSSGFGTAQETKEAPKPAPTAALPSDVAPDALAEAARLYQQGQFDAAIKKYQQILTEKPNSPQSYAGLARAYLKQKDVQQADETISKGVRLADNPREPW
jgi:tetratricopeptide (TPR) repeat protein